MGEFILKGSPIGHLPDCSLAEYFIPKIKSHPKDLIIQIDSETGATQTSKELLTTSLQFCEGLKKLGAREEDVLSVLTKNSIETYQVVLGSWWCGVTVAPMNGYLKPFEIKSYFEIIKPKYVYCDENVVEKVSSVLKDLSLKTTIILSGSRKNNSKSYTYFDEVLVDVNVDSYVPTPVSDPKNCVAGIFPSSGTSGLPKAIAITHRNLIFQDINLNSLKILKNKPKCLQISHFFWVTGVLSLMKSMSLGLTRVLIKNISPENLLQAIDKYKPEWTIIAPLSLLLLTNTPGFSNFNISSMKYVLVGGSRLSETIVERVKEPWSHAKIIHIYGTTEVSGNITVNEDADDVYSTGKVTPGVEVKFVDNVTGKTLGPNQRGEVYVRSPGVMKCYIANEEATKENKDEGGWFHTGDLGYCDDTGRIYLVDRLKEMIKVRNMQVAPVEVENVIMAVPGVIEAGVVGIPHDTDLHHLRALVVKVKNSAVTEKDIYSHVENTLSDYKHLTAGIFFVDSIPKTPSGKVKRTELKVLAKSFDSAK